MKAIRIRRKICVFLMVLSMGGFLFLTLASAQAASDYPTKPIQIIVGWTAGGSEDLRARGLAPTMEKVLGQPVIIVNKPGASAMVALTMIARSKPDGYTIGSASSSGLLFAPHMQKADYDPMNDFTFIAAIAGQGYGIVVRNDAPWKSLGELIDHIKKNPGKIKYGSYGVGSSGHLYMMMLGKNQGLDWDHVPFKGDSPTLTALLGGHVPVCVTTVAFTPHVKSGQLRLLAMIGQTRLRAFPEVPTLKEVGVDVAGVWDTLGILGPKGIPSEVLRKLENAIEQAVAGDEFKKIMDKLGTDVRYKDSRTYTESIKEAYPHIGEMIKKAGLSPTGK